MKTKLLSLLVALIATTSLWASKVITYTATEKLPKVTDKYSYGLHTNAFNEGIIFHEFSNGVGTITFAGEVKTIGSYAFYYCRGLTSVSIPNSVTTIGEDAFKGCSGLTSVTIPNSVTSIGEYAFYECSGLTSVTIGNSVTTIGGFAFSGCKGLTSVTIPNSVTTIESYAFSGCKGLTSVTIPNSVTTIESCAFDYCSALTSIEIPNSVTTIGNSAFYGCGGLTSVTIGNSVTSIGEQAFHICNIKSVTWNAKNCNSCAFGDQVETFIFGNEVETIPNFLCLGMSKLTTITIPNSVTTIGEYAFQYCSGLTSVTIGNSVTTIGKSAFRDCKGLKSIRFNNAVPPIFGYDVFNNVPTSATISVPCGYVPNYKKALSRFINYSSFGGDFPYTLTVSSSDNTIGTTEISDAPDCITNEAKIKATTVYGYSLNRWSDGNKDNPHTIVVTKDTNLVAYFAKNVYKVTTNATNGQVQGNKQVEYLDTCTLIATANYGYHFTQWSDGNTDNPRKVIVTRDTTFTAEFAKNIYTISVEAEHGSITGSGDYEYLSNVQLTATADEHYHFVRWGDGNTKNPRTISVTKDATYTAEFAPNNYQVSVQSSNLDMGYANGSGSYVYQSEQSISATANYGYHFTQWSDGNTDNPRTIQVLSDTTFTAEFAKNIYTISVEAEHGSVTGGGDYEYLSSVQLTATADEHYHFAQWSDWNTNNPRQITVEGDKTYTAIFSIDQHTISAYAEHGSVSGTGRYDYGTEAALFVIPDFGYEFSNWSDGSTDNPRNVLVTGNASYSCTCVLSTNGFCGNNLYWEYKDGLLIITGQGSMYNYSSKEVPWLLYCNNIKKVELSDKMTSIGNNAFYGCSNLTTITIPNSVTTIGESAFENCTYLKTITLGKSLTNIGCNAFKGDFRIEEITSYAEVTPNVCSSTFDGLSKQYIYLYVPENSIRGYQVDPNWNGFDIRTKSADKKPIDDENPVVTPTDQDVTITWPITEGTDTYTLTISKNGETVCVLTFNANGQLVNIAFAAPGHNGARQTPAATLTAQGYQFTVTGLTPGTDYAYSVTATDAGGQTIAEHNGNFSTTGGESGLQNVRNGAKASKYFHDGNLIIEWNGIKYTPAGQKVR